MSEEVVEKKIRITSDGCVNELDILKFSRLEMVTKRVQIGTEKQRRAFVKLNPENSTAKRPLLADYITGTIYDPVTKESTSPKCKLL